MNRILLILALLALGLLIASRLGSAPRRSRAAAALEVQAPQPVAPPEPRRFPSAPIPAATAESPSPPASTPGTPIIARLARLEARRRLTLAGSATYLDSTFTTPDSILIRWDDRSVIRVAIAAPDSLLPLVRAVRDGLRYWEQLGLGVSFVETPDSAAAEIVVDWIDRFDAAPPAGGEPGRTGLTAVRSNPHGVIESARITLARFDASGLRLGAAELRSIAIHEFGHALGLPHSGRRDDIMYPTVLTNQPSSRDRATASLLYALPPGPLRESATP